MACHPAVGLFTQSGCHQRHPTSPFLLCNVKLHVLCFHDDFNLQWERVLTDQPGARQNGFPCLWALCGQHIPVVFTRADGLLYNELL